ncbi:MAG: hypothetical protein K9M99_03200 [Candidatus Cloacimonetes bacterium]|nr:hypothetical protein [Candidatus Cloacimonadota bacterium]
MMYNKIIFLTIFLAVLFTAFAQKNDDMLELEDIIVVGKSQGFTDSLKTVPENLTYTRKADLSDFAYIPKLQTFSVTKNHTSALPVDQFLWLLDAGSQSVINSRLLYNSTKSSLLKFQADFHNEQTTSDWRNNELSFAWMPQFYQHQAIFSYYRELYEFDESSTMINTAQAAVPDWKIDLAAKGAAEISARLSYTFLQQDLDDDTEVTRNYDASLGIKWQKNRLLAGVSADFLAEQFMTQAWLAKNDLLLDQMGLWLATDQKQLAVSLKYSQAFSLGHDFSLILKNEPYQGKSTLRQVLEDNHYLDISSDFRQEIVPANNFICWQYESNFQTALWLNSRYILNRMNYVQSEEWPELIYEPEYLNVWENEIALSINWQWKNMSYEHRAGYPIYDKDINFAPIFTCRNEVNYQYKKMKAGFSLKYNTGRKDTEQSYLPDVMLININLGYQLMPNLSFSAKAINIADSDYREFDLPAEDKMSITGGFELSF